MPCAGALPAPPALGSPAGRGGGGSSGTRIDQHLRGRSPKRPHPERAQRETRLGREQRHVVQAPALRLEGHLHGSRALRWHVRPGPVRRTAAMHRQRDAVARRLARARQLDLEHRALPQEARLRRQQVQRQPAQRGMAHVHARHRAAGQQEGEQVAQVELEIDRRHQQHQQRERQHPPSARGQDVHIALREQRGVRARQPRLPPALQPPAERGDRVPRRYRTR